VLISLDFSGIAADSVRTDIESASGLPAMYFRKKTSGGRTYLQIVESRRALAPVRPPKAFVTKYARRILRRLNLGPHTIRSRHNKINGSERQRGTTLSSPAPVVSSYINTLRMPCTLQL
jgi:hypothetical protein